MCDDVDKAISRCPFLHNLSQVQGKAYASSVAINPLLTAPSARRPILEELHDFSNTFRLFHGPGGVVPLSGGPRLSEASAAPLPSAQPACLHLQQPLHAQQPARPVTQQPLHEDTAPAAPTKGPPCTRSPLAGAPLATISLGMGMVSREIWAAVRASRQRIGAPSLGSCHEVLPSCMHHSPSLPLRPCPSSAA